MTAASTFLLGVAAGAAVVVGGAKAWVYFQSRRLARYLRGDHKLSERAMRRLLADIYAAKSIVHARRWGGTFPVPRFDPKKLSGWARKAYDAGWTPPKGWEP